MTEPEHETTGASPSSADLTARRKARIEDILLVVALLGVAVALRYMRMPVISATIPGLSLMPASSLNRDPPSMDELWNLALTTGRGSPFDLYPRDTLLRGVPAWTSMTGAQPWWKVWSGLDVITHPPLYLQTLRFWRVAFGDGDDVAMAYSIVWSCVALVFIYLAVRLAVGRSAAFWSGAAFAVSPIAAYYALEIRSYAMLTAEGAIAIWLMVRLTKYGPRWRDVISLCTALLACMLTHYFVAPACVVAGIYALVLAGRRWSRVLVGGVIAAAIYSAIWLPFMRRQYHLTSGNGSGFLETATPQPLFLVKAALALPLRLLAEDYSLSGLILGSCAAVLLGIVAISIRQKTVRPFIIWYFATVGFLLAVDLLRQTQQLAIIRYCAPAQPAAVAFLPIIAACLSRRVWVSHAAGALLCAIVIFVQPYSLRDDAPTYTPAALSLARNLLPDDVLLVHIDAASNEEEFATEAIIQEFSHFPGCFPRDAATLHRPMSPQLLAQLRERRMWLIPVRAAVEPTEIVPGARLLATRQILIRSGMPLTPAYLLELPAASTTAAATRPSP